MHEILTVCCKFCTLSKVYYQGYNWQIQEGLSLQHGISSSLSNALCRAMERVMKLWVSATLNQLKACSSRPKGRTELFSQYTEIIEAE